MQQHERPSGRRSVSAHPSRRPRVRRPRVRLALATAAAAALTGTELLSHPEPTGPSHTG